MEILVALFVLAFVALTFYAMYLHSELNSSRKEAYEAIVRAEQAESVAMVRASEHLKKEEAWLRKDAIARSERTVKGKVAEQLVPFTEGFGYNPRDCRFVGSPFDFLVFEGMSEGTLDRIVFVEVKTGLSRLSKRERQVRDIIDTGEVFYEEVRL